MTLDQLPLRATAVVVDVADAHAEGARLGALRAHDPVARRLRELGFVAGEPLKLLARGPVAAEPLLVQVGYTRFALRRAEAARIRIQPDAPA